MINNLKPYPAMKDSGVPWLGEAPEHWSIARSKRLFRQRKEFARPEDQQLSATQAYGVIPQAIYESRTGYKVVKISLHLEKRRHVEADDFVISMRSFEGGLERAWSPGAIRSSYVVLKPSNEAHPGFFQYLFKSAPYIAALRGTADFIRDGQDLNFDNFCDVALPLIPPQEQSAIVRFLDHADRKIRRYIRAKQKLIKLLEEQKQAIIHRAVTRGLDPDVRLKPSGVEWLGDVPEHWEVTRLGRLIELTTGFPFKSDGFTQNAEDIRLLRGVNISPGKIHWLDVVRWPISELDKYNAFALQSGDIVLGMDRPIIQRGTRVTRVNETDVPALLLQRVARLRPRLSLHVDYLLLLLAGKSFANYLSPIFTGISVPHLSPEQIKTFRFALPPVDEQRQVIGWVEEQTRKTSTAIMSAELEIELLHEYRTRLIADVVTGKLDVREAAAGLSEDAELMDSIDPDDDLEDLDSEAEEQTEDP